VKLMFELKPFVVVIDLTSIVVSMLIRLSAMSPSAMTSSVDPGTAPLDQLAELLQSRLPPGGFQVTVAARAAPAAPIRAATAAAAAKLRLKSLVTKRAVDGARRLGSSERYSPVPSTEEIRPSTGRA
jgi:hypothetical protein